MAIDIPDELTFEASGPRREAWKKILKQAREGKGIRKAMRRQLQELCELCLKERDPDTKDLARDVVLRLLCSGAEPDRVPTAGPVFLSDWLWEPFRSPNQSVVISAFDPKYHRRDELAVNELARHLSRKDFPSVAFEAVPLGSADWGEVLNTPSTPRAVCIVGRVGMFGTEAREAWGSGRPRFRFPMDMRPPHVAPGEIAPEFHRIEERISRRPSEFLGRPDDQLDPAKHQRQADFIATQNEKERKDYGLIQRYTRYFDTRPTTVITCAGCSDLGTLGAARFLVELAESQIMLPSLPDVDACFEALIEVPADLAKFPRAWRPKHRRLLSMSVDKQIYSTERKEWTQRPVKVIDLVYDSDDRPAEVFLDGESSRIAKKDSMILHLLVELCELRLRYPSQPQKLADLAEMKDIWDGEQTDETNVRRRSRQLRDNYLGDSLTVDEFDVALHAQVVQWERRASPAAV